MNASGLILLVLFAVFAVVSAFPNLGEFKYDGNLLGGKEEPQNLDISEDSAEGIGLRFRRVTCDLLSINVPIGSLNHAACAAHCLAMRKGFRGGRCKDGVCHCRK